MKKKKVVVVVVEMTKWIGGAVVVVVAGELCVGVDGAGSEVALPDSVEVGRKGEPGCRPIRRLVVVVVVVVVDAASDGGRRVEPAALGVAFGSGAVVLWPRWCSCWRVERLEWCIGAPISFLEEEEG